MMQRTTIMLPKTLKRKVESRARQEKKSLGSFIRESLEHSLQSNTPRSSDPLFANLESDIFEDDGPADLAENHDKYILRKLAHEHGLRRGARKRRNRR
jgi:hypothetical protein